VALPETISESSVFGREQKYFSWIRKPKENKDQEYVMNHNDAVKSIHV
jgi:hypothetical protein